MPFLTPYPRYCRNIQLGTRIAGETAAITKPIENARETGKLRISIDISAIAVAYTTWGIKVSKITITPLFLNDSYKPPRRSIIPRHSMRI